MELRTRIIIGVGTAIVIAGIIGTVIFLRVRATADLTDIRPAPSSPTVSMEVPGAQTPDEDAIRKEREFIENSTYDERLKLLAPEVQKQITSPPTTPARPTEAAAPPTSTASPQSGQPATPTEPASPAPASGPDADGDGLTAEQEANLGTDVNNADTDGDGLTDRQEAETYKTDPLKADSDIDTFLDGAEVQAGYNPLGPGRCARETCIP